MTKIVSDILPCRLDPPVVPFERTFEGYSSLPVAFEWCERGYNVRLDQGKRLVVSAVEESRFDKPSLSLYSSGSTGLPKQIIWKWSALKRTALLLPTLERWRWATPFRPDSFAGVQVALQAWLTDGKVLGLGRVRDDVWNQLDEERPQALCCTPTFIDLLLQMEPHTQQAGSWAPKQVTLGGEVLRERLGQRLRERFPTARFTLVYATSELGLILKTHRLDGWYEAPGDSCKSNELRIRDGVLEIKIGDQFISTGDLAEFRGGLLRIVGRADNIANVGGTKVLLASVEELAEQVDGVRRAKAVAETNPVSGQIVALKFAVEQHADPEEVLGRLKDVLLQTLPKPAWPRLWTLDPVEPVANAKRSAV